MSETTEETGQALVKRQPVPRELAALGVVIAEDSASGMQMVVIPDAVKAKANVLMPVEAFQQADPHWTPSLRAVRLDPSKDGPHFYKQGSGKVAPRKQALELLADAAGVVSTRVTIVPGSREAREVGGVRAESFEHHAMLHIRKSDGTLRLIEGGKTYEPDAEYEEIRDAVLTSTNKWWREKKGDLTEEQADEREIRKRWLTEIKNSKAKNESKAILRAIRSALQIPHTFTEQEVKKPFIVIGWNFTPPNDPETRAAIAQAVGMLYGGEPASSRMERPALAAGTPGVGEDEDVDPETGEVVPLSSLSAAETPEEPEGDAPAVPPPAAAEKAAQGAVEPEPEPDPGPLEPEAEEAEQEVVDEVEFAPELPKDPAVELAEAAKSLIPPVGMFGPGGSAGGETGKTLDEILDYSDAKDPERGRNWIGWALRNWEAKGGDPVFLEALKAFAAVYAQDVMPAS